MGEGVFSLILYGMKKEEGKKKEETFLTRSSKKKVRMGDSICIKLPLNIVKISVELAIYY